MAFGIICALAVVAMFFFYIDPSASSFAVGSPELMVGMLGAIIISIIYYIITSFRLKKTKNWVKVRGSVTSIRPEGNNERKQKYQINYKYEVGGTNFFGNKFSLNEDSANAFKIKRACKIPADMLRSRAVNGRPIVVYYNPELYGESVISPNARASIWIAHIPAYTVIFVCMYYISVLIYKIIEKNEVGGIMGLIEKLL